MPRSRILPALVLAFLLAVFLSPAFATESKWLSYDRDAFIKSQKAGGTVIVSVHADW